MVRAEVDDMMMRRTKALLLACAWLGGGCATRYLPPPAAPSRAAITPGYAPPPLREGEGQVSFDVARGRARVELVTERTQAGPYATSLGLAPRGVAYAPLTQYTLRPVCETPCVANLPLGPRQVLFTDVDPGTGRTSTAFINVGAAPSAVRHAMGRETSSLGGVVGAAIMAGLGGAVALAGGLLMGFQDASRPGHENLALAGGVTLGVGLALAAGGAVLGVASRPTLQPGATTQWTP
ncbi:MAG: hypothetical protein U0324_42125 [Polyangiales bacterium]